MQTDYEKTQIEYKKDAGWLQRDDIQKIKCLQGDAKQILFILLFGGAIHVRTQGSIVSYPMDLDVPKAGLKRYGMHYVIFFFFIGSSGEAEGQKAPWGCDILSTTACDLLWHEAF